MDLKHRRSTSSVLNGRWHRPLIYAVCAGAIALLTGEVAARGYFWFVKSIIGRPQRLTVEGHLQRYDPRLGYRLIPNSRGRVAGPEFDIEVVINSAGLRQGAVVPYERRSGLRRILVAGDSFTFGHGIDVEYRFTELLAAYQPGVEIVNTGLAGTGTDQQLLFFLEEGRKYKPDLTVLCYMVENIVRNAASERRQPDGTIVGKPRFILTNGVLTLTNVPVPPPRISGAHPTDDIDARMSAVPLPFKRQLRASSALYQLLHKEFADVLHAALKSNRVPFPEYAEGREEWVVTEAIIKTFAESARSIGSEFLLVIIPTAEYVYREYIDDQPNRLIESMGERHGIPVLDLLPGLKRAASSSPRLYFAQDGHWSPEGHKFAARLIAEHLGTRMGTRTSVAASPRLPH